MNPPDSRSKVSDAKSKAAAQNVMPQIAKNETLRFEIAETICRIVLVDDVLPMHSATRNSARPRLTYVEGEIAHFDLCGHRYAIVNEKLATENTILPIESPEDLPVDVHAILTNRELQIVQLICMGYLTKQVADRLKLSQFTVRSYLKTVYCKLGVRSRGAMVYRYAQAFRHASE
jgi:DNA-binding CsgD family transcriptional regulator